MEQSSDFQSQSNPLRKRDMGLAGAIIVIAQAITQEFYRFHSVNDISDELREIRADQEKYFVKKSELKKFAQKIDDLKKEIARLNSKIESKTIINHDKFSKFKKQTEEDEEIIGCNFHIEPKNLQRWHL